MRFLSNILLLGLVHAGVETISPHSPASNDDDQQLLAADTVPSFLEVIKNPSQLLATPPFDVTANSKGGRVHVSYCSS